MSVFVGGKVGAVGAAVEVAPVRWLTTFGEVVVFIVKASVWLLWLTAVVVFYVELAVIVVSAVVKLVSDRRSRKVPSGAVWAAPDPAARVA